MLARRLCASRTARAVLVLALLGGMAAGCAPKKTRRTPAVSGQADKFLFDRGTEALAKKRWLRAREFFRQLVDNYPQSPYRPDAKLGLADTYLGENTTESVILSVNEYREFLTFYPTNERTYYAQYKLGMAHHAQMLGPQRDQTETREAIKEFETFLARYASSPLGDEGRKRLRECRDRLSQSNYEVGLFYWRQRWFPGAIDRFKSVLKDDPEFTGRDGVYYHLADALSKLNLGAEALPYLDRLVQEFEKSDYIERGQQLMAELKTPRPADATAGAGSPAAAKEKPADTKKESEAAAKKAKAPEKQIKKAPTKKAPTKKAPAKKKPAKKKPAKQPAPKPADPSKPPVEPAAPVKEKPAGTSGWPV